MRKNINIRTIKKIDIYLEQIIPTLDRIGSHFSDTETTALALLLFFREENILDKLAYIKNKMDVELSSALSEDEYDKFIEQDINYWKLPYNKDETLNRLRKYFDDL